MKTKGRRRLFGTGKVSKYRIINFLLAIVLLSAYIYAFSSIELLEEGGVGFRNGIAYYVFQFILVSVSLILITALGYILHHGFGAIARMEKMLEDVGSGNYSLRMYLRKGDFLRSLAEKLNKIIKLLDQGAEKDRK